ncbi:hypothetical protein [Pararhizobium polonicum]|uniref:hypothetical protein n=1 Tax=Pararhizobium polonicum TaxID=1612624 RepID=UPI001112A149|nr:hypothetical protein [Pararhizobium polonicum]
MRTVFSLRAQNEENNLYKLDGKYRRNSGDDTASSISATTSVEDRMQGSKPVMQNRPAAFGAQSGTHFSWNMAAQAAALAAAFIFVSALVFGAI